MDSCHGNQLRRVFSFNSIRPHGCPNCQCNSNHGAHQEFVQRPVSPVIGKVLSVNKISYLQKKPMIIESRQMQQKPESIYFRRGNNFETKNLNTYSNSSIRSNGSITAARSKQNIGLRVLASPSRKSPAAVNIRYVSPGRHYNSHTQQNPKIVNINSSREYAEKPRNIYYATGDSYKTGGSASIINQLTFQNRSNQAIKQTNNASLLIKQTQLINMDAQSYPRVPSILKKKSSSNKKRLNKSPQQVAYEDRIPEKQPIDAKTINISIINSNRQSNNSNAKKKKDSLTQICKLSEQSLIKDAQLGTASAILSRNAIKSYPQRYLDQSNSSNKINGQWSPSAYDVLLEEDKMLEQQHSHKVQVKGSVKGSKVLSDNDGDHIIARQIFNDLKLNYDYFQTTDISKISAYGQ